MQNKIKNRYIEIANNDDNLLIFNKPWWLDLQDVNWKVIEIPYDNQKSILIPIFERRKFFFKYSVLPNLVHKICPIYIENKGAIENKFFDNLFLKTKEFLYFSITLFENLNLKNIYKKNNFEIVTSKSYFVNKKNKDYKNKFNSDVKRLINKSKSNRLLFKSINDVEYFIKKYNQNLTNSKKKNYFSNKQIKKVYEKLKQHKCGKIFGVFDEKNNLHSCALIAWDMNDVYLIFFSSNNALKKYGGSCFLIERLINFSQKINRNFDFEGGTIKSIGNFYMKFTTSFKELHQMDIYKYKFLKRLFNFYFKYWKF